jgi:hypothetical protein
MIAREIIDCHVHLFPDRLFEAIWEYFTKNYRWNLAHRLYYKECIDHLREQGVEQFIYSNYAHRPGIASSLVDWNHRVLEEYPQLYCYTAYHPGDGDSLSYARAALAHPRVLGFKLHFLVQNFPPDDERLFPLYELVMERKKRLLFHVGTGPVGNEHVGVERFLRVMERFPSLAVTVAHLGALEYVNFFNILDSYPQLMMDTAFTLIPELPGHYNLGHELFEIYQERLLYGSDFPFIIYDYRRELDMLLSMKLTDSVFYAILSNNAQLLFAAASSI